MQAPVCHRVGPLTAQKRRNLPDSAFGLPHRHAYPIPDPKHAAAAKGRALQQLERGSLSRSEYNQIVRRANVVISRCRRGQLGFVSNSEEQWFFNNAHWIMPLFTFMGGLTLGAWLVRRSSTPTPS